MAGLAVEVDADTRLVVDDAADDDVTAGGGGGSARAATTVGGILRLACVAVSLSDADAPVLPAPNRWAGAERSGGFPEVQSDGHTRDLSQ